ncbi:MAG: hypothetical protein ACHQ2Z_10590, partial [Elusimicrobiota bacterium]
MNRLTVAIIAALVLTSAAKAQQLDFDGRSSGSFTVKAVLQAASGSSAGAVPTPASAPAEDKTAAPSCAVSVVDTANKTSGRFTVVSRSERRGATTYIVSNGRSSEETLVRANDEPIEASNSVPHP